MRVLSVQEENLRRELYAEGLNDRKLAEKLGTASVTIAGWRHRRDLPPNYSPIFKPKTPGERQFEYLLGVIHGDGYVESRRTTGRVQIPIALQEEGYKNILKQIFIKAWGYTPKESVHNNCFYLGICSLKIAEQFSKYKRDGRWMLPKLKHPEEYLAGLWDTDGSIQFRAYHNPKTRNCAGTVVARSIVLEQKSNGNLKLVTPILKSLNFSPSLKTYIYKNKLGTFKKDVIRIFSSDFALFKSTIPIKHPRKIAALEKITEYERQWRNQYGTGPILTNAQINQINVLRRKGLMYTQIAEQLGISKSTAGDHFIRDEGLDWRKCNYIMNGRCRKRVFLALDTSKTARQITEELEIRVEHANRSLKELTAVKLTTKEEKIYRLTNEGRILFSIFKKWARLHTSKEVAK